MSEQQMGQKRMNDAQAAGDDQQSTIPLHPVCETKWYVDKSGSRHIFERIPISGDQLPDDVGRFTGRSTNMREIAPGIIVATHSFNFRLPADTVDEAFEMFDEYHEAALHQIRSAEDAYMQEAQEKWRQACAAADQQDNGPSQQSARLVGADGKPMSRDE